ncbi:DUF1456 family protein [Flavobacterium sp. SUN052]|uniref:DUF1456 family protein n=1 Tax=Flavobacterium sp. SUN052 TaxID=3002441 RepID=UPI00237D8A6E|nr:DUF1456 family protein [Flavobacterium sp. SUN052]MEC4005747.1 DUF1456 family protein [Flavobacterium sp. SUN052]
MNNNDIFKKLRVALMLRDDQIVSILELVDFRISKSELGAFFRDEKHENFVECGDQILRNFLNGLVIHLRGTKENPKNPMDVIAVHKQEAKPKEYTKSENTPKKEFSLKPDFKKKPTSKPNFKDKKPTKKIEIVEKVQYKNGKNKKG